MSDDAQVHLLLNRIAELTLQVETIRAMCEQRIEDMRPFLTPAVMGAREVLAVLDGGSDE